MKKLKNQKGATGADIVISMTIILVTIVVVSIIYLNTTLQTRNTTRTAGATRIATNILENIDKLSYKEFVSELDNFTKETTGDYINYYVLSGQAFSTKIPTGYTVHLNADPNYGSHSEDTEKTKQFDLVREVNLIITFSVGDKEEKIDFKTVKVREVIDETNEPNTDYLTTDEILSYDMNFYPIKYLESSKAYIKTNKTDSSWYNYSNKEWATVIVSKKAESEIFDINGKFVGQINTDKEDDNYTEKFVWIPRFFTQTITENSEEKDIFYAFAYLASGSNKIVSEKLDSVTGNVSTLNINTFEMDVNASETIFNDKSGKWVSCEIVDEEKQKTGIQIDEAATLLNESKYGPYMEH